MIAVQPIRDTHTHTHTHTHTGLGFVTFFVVNLAVWSQGSSGAVPFPTMLAIVAMWFCISLPLVFVGAVFGFKRETISLPVSTAQVRNEDGDDD